MRRRDKNQIPLFDSLVRFGPERPSLAYVVQMHDATQLHFDFRLEIDGIMKSWAIPKGPSIDPSVRRLAVQVRDHAKAHNLFEGVILPGGYGAGTVLVWDRGTVAPTEIGAFDVEMFRDAYEAGKLSFVLSGGKRIGGRWTLTRCHAQYGENSHWMLQKHADQFSSKVFEPVNEFRTSVVTELTLRQIEILCAAQRRRNSSVWATMTPPLGTDDQGDAFSAALVGSGASRT